MATIVDPVSAARAEKRFFFTMACVMALVIAAGFSANLILGRSSFGLPLIYHLHAFAFFGWVALYIVQNGLIAADNVAVHRRLGRLAVLWIPLMVVLGLAMILVSVRAGSRFFFDLNEFLFGNALQLIAFAGLAAAAIRMRRRTDWHRRLMYCSMAVLTGPGLGRLLPMPLFIPWSWWAVISATLIFPLVGMVWDRRRAGRVHPAWWWGAGAILAALLAGDLIAYSPLGQAATRALVEGTPGADRPLAAFLP